MNLIYVFIKVYFINLTRKYLKSMSMTKSSPSTFYFKLYTSDTLGARIIFCTHTSFSVPLQTCQANLGAKLAIFLANLPGELARRTRQANLPHAHYMNDA